MSEAGSAAAIGGTELIDVQSSPHGCALLAIVQKGQQKNLGGDKFNLCGRDFAFRLGHAAALYIKFMSSELSSSA